MSKKHTPGPWEIEPHSTIDKCFNVGPGISIDYDDVDHEEQDANARLVSAAPKLLRIVKQFVDDPTSFSNRQFRDIEKLLKEIEP